MHLHFSWIGLIVFLLPLPFTLLYMLFPPNDSPASAAPPPKLVTLLEQSSVYCLLPRFACLQISITLISGITFSIVL